MMAITYNNSKIPRKDLSILLDPANKKCWPGSGTKYYDISGNKNHCTLVNSPTFNPTSVSWNGTTQFGTISANQKSLDFRNEQTICMWLKFPDNTIRRNPWNQAYGGYGTITHEPSDTLNYYYGDNGGNSTPYVGRTSPTMPINTWVMMTTTRDTGYNQWYKNIEASGESAHTYSDLPISTADITIASGYTTNWEGEMGPILVYKRRLYIDEITQIYDSYKGRYV